MSAGGADTDLEALATGGLRLREEAMARLLGRPADDLVSAMLAAVSGRDFRLRNAALEVLARLGPASLPLLAARLQDADDEQRMFIAPVLADFRTPAALDLLHGWLASEDPNLVAMSCEAVGRVGDAASVDPLLRLLDADVWMAGPAVTALGELGRPEALPALLVALENPDLRMFAAGAVARIGDASAWPSLAAVLREEPDLIGLVLPEFAPLAERLDPEAFRAEAGEALEDWLLAARTMLLDPGATPEAAARVLALAGHGEDAAVLVNRILDVEENEAVFAAIRQLAGGAAALRNRLDAGLEDESLRRAVRLIFDLLEDADRWALDLLAHPAESVRLEIVLHAGRRNFVPELAVALLSDPDNMVRGMAIEGLRAHWNDPAMAARLAEELDPDSLPGDVLQALILEAPPVISGMLGRALPRPAPDAGSEAASRRLYWTVTAREDPAAFLERLADPELATSERLLMVGMVAGIPGRAAAATLAGMLDVADPALAYAAAEALVRHPELEPDDLRPLLLRDSIPLRTVLAAWVADNDRGDAWVEALLAWPRPLPDELEREVLRAARRHAPELARARFAEALDSGVWFLQVEGVRGLQAAGISDARARHADRLLPLATEVLDQSGGDT